MALSVARLVEGSIPLDFAAVISWNTVPKTLFEDSRSFAVKEHNGFPPEALVAAALNVLHYRYTYAENAIIGLRSGNALLAARVHVDGDSTLSEVLKSSFDAVQAAIAIDGDEIPIYTWISGPNAELRSGLEPFNPRMHWQLLRQDGSLLCHVTYNRAFYPANLVQHLVDNLIEVVEYLSNSPSISVADIVFSHAGTQLSQAGVFSHASPSSHNYSSLADAFAVTTARHSNQLAIVDGDVSLTYAEFDALSTTLAEIIVTGFGGKDVPQLIACCIPPSPLAIVVIFSILKSGAAYVPLDIRLPCARLESLIADSGAGMLITTEDTPKLSLEASGATSLDVSLFWSQRDQAITSNGSTPHLHKSRLDDLAYVMYTSGSTGLPKGVCIKQSSVLALAYDRGRFLLAPGQRVAQINNLAWDGSVFDVWCTLLSGATLVCFNRYDVLEPTKLTALFHRFHVDCCFITTSLFRHILTVSPDLFQHLSTILIGGESIDFEQYQKLQAINKKLEIHNMYGPTETCCYTTSYSVPPLEVSDYRIVVPIGRPLEHTQCLVADAKNRLVPPGVVGELIIGGRGVGAGYLNRPQETGANFVDLSFEKFDQPSTTFYKTGDLVKWLPDGELLFIGRKQAGQIKIRGQRMELSEVESGLVRTGLVSHAAVAFIKPADGSDAYLVAYAVKRPDEGEAAGSDVLKALKKTFPSYMIPRWVQYLNSLPLTNSGKLDRRRIQDMAMEANALGIDPARIEEPYSPPESSTEKAVCDIFQMVLPVTVTVGVMSNFFDAGGHSLLAMRLKWHLESEFSVPITVQDIFTSQTPRSLATRIEELQSASAALPKLLPTPPGEWQPLSYGQQRIYRITQKILSPKDGGYNAVAWLRLHGSLDEEVLERSIQEILRRHEVLRSIFVEVDGKPMARVTEWLPFLGRVDTDPSWSEAQLHDHLRTDAKSAFPLAKQPPFRPVLYRLGDSKFILMMCMHHIITDGYTHDILFSELSSIYTSFVLSQNHGLPPLPSQFASYAQWQTTAEYDQLLAPQFVHWENKLRGQNPASFPPDFARPLSVGMAGATYIVPFQPDLVGNLEALCKAEKVTMHMLLMAAFRALHFQLIGEHDGSFGSSIANRRLPETLKMCGYFNNIIIYRIHVEDNDTFLNILRRVRTVALEAYANQDAPLALISRRIQTSSAGPPIRTMFAYHNFEMTTFKLGNVAAESFDLDMHFNGCQLELYFVRDGNTIKADFHYPVALYKQSTIIWLGEKLSETLAQIVTDSNFRVVKSETGWAPPVV